MVDVRQRLIGRLLSQHPDDVLRRPSRGNLLLEVCERLDVKERNDVRVEERLEPHGFVHAQPLKRRLVEDRDRPHSPILPRDAEVPPNPSTGNAPTRNRHTTARSD